MNRIPDSLIFNALQENDLKGIAVSPQFNKIKEKYVVYHKQIERRMDGSSGSAYGAFIETVVKEGYYFTGTVFDEELELHHVVTNNPEEIPTILGYKPVQSECGKVFSQIRELLNHNEKVLFCGTSLQCFLLKHFVDNHENLTTVDLVNTEFIAREVLLMYAEEIEKKNESKVTDIRFYNKEFPYANSKRITLANGHVIFTDKPDIFDKLLNSGQFTLRNKSDVFKSLENRVADITIGAYKVENKEDDGVGYAYVSVNTPKGEDLFSKAKKRLVVVKEGGDVEISSVKYQTCKCSDCVDVSVLQKKCLDDFSDKVPQGRLYAYKRILGALQRGWSFSQHHICTYLKFIKLNFFSKQVHTDYLNNGFFYISPHCAFKLDKDIKIVLHGPLHMGRRRIISSKQETRLRMEKGARIIVNESCSFGAGSNVEIYKDGLLEVGILNSNAELTIICGEYIKIGTPNNLARNATIRDTSGHLVATPGYKMTKPVIIGNHVWVCTGSTIMPGVTVGDGSIVGASSFVTKKIPSFTMVQGNPAAEVGPIKYFRI